jgi:hypothetical protein
MAAHAYGEETLGKKREAAEKIVGIHAGLAAANALNPIPGLDVSVDLGILTAMAVRRQAHLRAAVFKGIHGVADRLAPYLTEKFVLASLRRMGLEVWVKNTSKWVPFVGTLVSAGLGYKLTYRFGEMLIDDCEAAAKEVIAALAEESKAVK